MRVSLVILNSDRPYIPLLPESTAGHHRPSGVVIRIIVAVVVVLLLRRIVVVVVSFVHNKRGDCASHAQFTVVLFPAVPGQAQDAGLRSSTHFTVRSPRSHVFE